MKQSFARMLPEYRLLERCPQAASLPAGLEGRVRPRVAREKQTIAPGSLVKGVRPTAARLVDVDEGTVRVSPAAGQDVLDERVVLRKRKGEPTAVLPLGGFVHIPRMQGRTAHTRYRLERDAERQIVPCRDVQVKVPRSPPKGKIFLAFSGARVPGRNNGRPVDAARPRRYDDVGVDVAPLQIDEDLALRRDRTVDGYQRQKRADLQQHDE